MHFVSISIDVYVWQHTELTMASAQESPVPRWMHRIGHATGRISLADSKWKEKTKKKYGFLDEIESSFIFIDFLCFLIPSRFLSSSFGLVSCVIHKNYEIIVIIREYVLWLPLPRLSIAISSPLLPQSYVFSFSVLGGSCCCISVIPAYACMCASHVDVRSFHSIRLFAFTTTTKSVRRPLLVCVCARVCLSFAAN